LDKIHINNFSKDNRYILSNNNLSSYAMKADDGDISITDLDVQNMSVCNFPRALSSKFLVERGTDLARVHMVKASNFPYPIYYRASSRSLYEMSYGNIDYSNTIIGNLIKALELGAVGYSVPIKILRPDEMVKYKKSYSSQAFVIRGVSEI